MGNLSVTGEFPTQRPKTRIFDFFTYASINGWVNNREAGDLIRHRAHCDVTVINKRYTFVPRDTQPFWNIAQSTAAISPYCCVQNPKMIEQTKQMLWTNGIVWYLSLRWPSEEFLKLHNPPELPDGSDIGHANTLLIYIVECQISKWDEKIKIECIDVWHAAYPFVRLWNRWI